MSAVYFCRATKAKVNILLFQNLISSALKFITNPVVTIGVAP